MKQLKRTNLLLIVSLLLTSFFTSVSAQFVTYHFRGILDNAIGTVPGSTPFYGSFSYDINNPQFDIGGGAIPDVFAIDAFEFRVGSEFIRLSDAPTDGPQAFLDVTNNPPGIFNIDAIDISVSAATWTSVGGTLVGGTIGGIDLSTANFDIGLYDDTGTAIDSEDLPGGGLTVGDFPFTTFIYIGSIGTSGQITDLSSQVIPEPSTYALMIGVGSVGLVAWKRRKREDNS